MRKKNSNIRAKGSRCPELALGPSASAKGIATRKRRIDLPCIYAMDGKIFWIEKSSFVWLYFDNEKIKTVNFENVGI